MNQSCFQLRFLTLWLIATLGVFGCGGNPEAIAKDSVTYHRHGAQVNLPMPYPVVKSDHLLKCEVDLGMVTGTIDKRIFGTNLEWFNDGGGLASRDVKLRKQLVELTKQQGATVMRYPGGTLSDFYHWRDGTGPNHHRKRTKHPTDPGISFNNFGTPEFFRFLKATNSEGLITVNAGTGTPEEAADWVAYANQVDHPDRIADGIKSPANIKLWEIGNELYLPGNPGDQIITVDPKTYAKRYLAFSKAIKKVDPSVTTVAIGIAKSHIGPDTQYPNWTKVLLAEAADEIDMIAVHNAYFPVLFRNLNPDVKDLYPALWASPEAVDRSLDTLEALLKPYEEKKQKEIGIAVTEWGALFRFVVNRHHWVDHVKTMGTGVYIARMMQVFMEHPHVKMTNYFKLSDRSFMGWIGYDGQPKVPFWVLALYANHTGAEKLAANIESPTYDSPALGIMMAEKQVPEVTVLASKDEKNGKVYVNLVNRSLSTSHPIDINFTVGEVEKQAKLLTIAADEVTSHNGRDIPPELPYKQAFEPYSTMPANSIRINTQDWDSRKPVVLKPFSVATLVFNIKDIK